MERGVDNGGHQPAAAILRYIPAAHAQGMIQQLAAAGVLNADEQTISMSAECQRSAQAVLNLVPAGLDDLWSSDEARLSDLADLVAPVAEASLTSGLVSPNLIAKTLRPAVESDGYRLWRSLSIIRRHRFDCHAQAWAAAGHEAESIRNLAPGAARQAIEDQTNELNATIWAGLNPADRQSLLIGLAGLNGVGDPS